MDAAGLIGINDILKIREGGVNCNADLLPGLYQNPTNAPNSYGLLVELRTSGVRLQLFVSTDDKYYIRSLSVAGWSSWKQFAG